MQRILWATTAAVLIGLPVAARAGEPRAGLVDRGREIVQAGWHKCCDKTTSCCGKVSGCHSKSCRACNPRQSCCDEDIRIGKLIDTLFCGEKACDRKCAALKLDNYNWTEHPEIVAALTYAMQSDCDRCVRIAAADSLKDMRVSEPDSIGAMRFTHEADPSCRVRYKAKWGVIKGEESRPPSLTYVSGYATTNKANGQMDEDEPEPRPAPRLRAAPAPEPEPTPRPILRQRDEERAPAPAAEPDKGTDAKRGVRGFISTAMAKVRPRS